MVALRLRFGSTSTSSAVTDELAKQAAATWHLKGLSFDLVAAYLDRDAGTGRENAGKFKAIFAYLGAHGLWFVLAAEVVDAG